MVDREFQTPEKQVLVETWKRNFKLSCHVELDLSKSLQAVVLYGCGYVSFSYSAYIFTIYRQRILRYSSVPIQDFDALNYNGLEASLLGKIFIRLLLIGPIVAIAIAPSQLIDKQLFGPSPLGPILILIANYNLPLLIAGLYLFTVYDKAVFWI